MTPEENTPGLPSDPLPTPAEVLQSGQRYVKENPLVIAAFALLLGIVIGALCGHREPKSKDAAKVARAVLDDVIEGISGRLPAFKGKSCCANSFLEHCQNAGKKLKWW